MADTPAPMDRLLQGVESLSGGLARTVDGLVGRWVQRLDDDACCGGGAEPRGEAPSHAANGDAGLGELELAEEVMSAGERHELALLREVEGALRRGRELDAWWRQREADRRFAERFDLARTFNEPMEGFGFFDTAPLDGRDVPVMGNYQEMFYDQPKHPTADAAAAAWMRDQMREFVLRYFMRVSDFSAPTGFSDIWRPPLSTLLSLLSWCPKETDALRGFGFRQLWYKERGGEGRVRRFHDNDAYRVVDLRELGERYEWIVVEVRIFDFQFSVAPFGSGGPRLSLPLAESSYLVLAADFIAHEERPAPGVLARYGLGYSFIRDPRPSLVGYGPGRFAAALERITFEVAEDGSVRVPMVFVANRPERVVDLDLDPVDLVLDTGLRLVDLASLGFAGRQVELASRLLHALPRPRLRFDPVLGYVAAADLVSGGMAADYLCIDRRQLEKEFLVKHYMQHYQTIAGSLATWRLVADWRDEAALPRWVREGRQP